MAHPVELDPYEHAKCVQIYGWKCLICSVEAKDQIGLELQHIADGVVYIDGIDGTKRRYAARNARKHTICLVSAQINHNQQNGPLYAAFLNVNSKQVRVDLPKPVIFKRVTIPIAVAKQKKGKPRPPKQERQSKDGRRIGVRMESSSGKNRKEQKWSEEDINTCFDLWEVNSTKKPEERLSKRQISLQTGVPYTTVCERLSGRHGGSKRGKIAGGRRQGKVLDASKSKQVTVTVFN